MPNTTAITIDDGSVRVPIQNKYGDELGEFKFRPTDIGMMERYNKMAKDFDEIFKPLENVGINQNGEAEDEDDEEAVAAIQEATNRLYKAIDYLFDGNMSEAFFKKMNPFSPVNGRFYCETAIELVGDFIGEYMDKEADKINHAKIESYTQGYKKAKK